MAVGQKCEHPVDVFHRRKTGHVGFVDPSGSQFPSTQAEASASAARRASGVSSRGSRR